MSGALAAVRNLAARLTGSPWFGACGLTLHPDERDEAANYLRGLDLPAFPIESVFSFEVAGATARRTDWSRAWWDAEARAAQQLKAEAIAKSGEAPLLAALSEVTAAASELYALAAAVAANHGTEDEGLIRAAAGAGAMAAHQMGLVLAAGAGDAHALACKYRLFAGGRWLLGVMGERCYLF